MGDSVGYVDGVHFTGHVACIIDLKRAQRTDDAIALLLKCVAATEAEDQLDRWRCPLPGTMNNWQSSTVRGGGLPTRYPYWNGMRSTAKRRDRCHLNWRTV